MILGSVFSTISAVLTALCLLWCIGLGIYVLVRFIIRKIKFKRELKKRDIRVVNFDDLTDNEFKPGGHKIDEH